MPPLPNRKRFGKIVGTAGFSLSAVPPTGHHSRIVFRRCSMNRLLLGGAVAALLATAVAFSRQQPSSTSSLDGFQVAVGEKNPWTSLKPNVGGDQFQFVVVSD